MFSLRYIIWGVFINYLFIVILVLIALYLDGFYAVELVSDVNIVDFITSKSENLLSR